MKLQRITIIFTLALMTIFSAGSFIVFKILKLQIHSEMREMIRNGNSGKKTLTIIVNQNNERNLTWLEDDEFIYNGEFYDVVSFKVSGSTTELLVVNDGKEKKLFEGIAVFQKGDENGNAAATLTQLGKLLTLKYMGEEKLNPSPEFKLLLTEFISEDLLDVPSVFIGSASPPPDLLTS